MLMYFDTVELSLGAMKFTRLIKTIPLALAMLGLNCLSTGKARKPFDLSELNSYCYAPQGFEELKGTYEFSLEFESKEKEIIVLEKDGSFSYTWYTPAPLRYYGKYYLEHDLLVFHFLEVKKFDELKTLYREYSFDEADQPERIGMIGLSERFSPTIILKRNGELRFFPRAMMEILEKNQDDRTDVWQFIDNFSFRRVDEEQ